MASRDKWVWEIGVENLRALYEQKRMQVPMEQERKYKEMVAIFRSVGRTSEKDLELCRELSRYQR